MLCEKCGAVLTDADMFCGECGTPVSTENKTVSLPVCKGCGNLLQEGEIFCGVCGMPLHSMPTASRVETTKKCPKCGIVYTDDSVFCENCGQNLNSPVYEKVPKPGKTIESGTSVSYVPDRSSVNGEMKTTMKTSDKPFDYKESADKAKGNSFFGKPGDL